MIAIPDDATMEEAQRLVLVAALERNGGRRDAAARQLRIARSTVFEWIRRWGVSAEARR